MGADCIVLDRMDGQAVLYVGAAVASRPSAFCVVRSFTLAPGGGGTYLLGLVEGSGGGQEVGGEVSLPVCPHALAGDVDTDVPAYVPDAVPLLVSDSAER